MMRLIVLFLVLLLGSAHAQMGQIPGWPPIQANATANLNGLDPTTASNVTLDSTGLIVTNTGGASTNQGAAGYITSGQSTGKFYIEGTFTTIVPTNLDMGIGFGTTTSTFTGMGGGSGVTGGIFFQNLGTIYANGTFSGDSLGSRSSGDVIGVAVDLTNHLIWFKLVSGTPSNWNGTVGADPATGTGGVTIPSGTYIPFVTFGGSGATNGSVLTVNLGASAFTGTVPTGYTSGWVPGSTYTGPGDIQTFASWYSCAYVYKGSMASTSTNLCDLVAKTGGASVCTLRGSSSGAVDLTNPYCAGATPATACAAASGGSCVVSQAYDQTGNSRPATQATLSRMPILTFNALGGLPCMTMIQANQNNLTTAATWAQAQPYTGSVVSEKTITTGAGGPLITATFGITQAGVANQWGVFAGTGVNLSATDNVFHAFQMTFNGASGTYNLDGTTTASINAGTGAASSNISMGVRSGSGMSGVVCEAGWAAGDQSANFATMNSNQHTRYGF